MSESRELQPLLPFTRQRSPRLAAWRESIARVLESIRLHQFILTLVGHHDHAYSVSMALTPPFQRSPSMSHVQLWMWGIASLQEVAHPRRIHSLHPGSKSWLTYLLLLTHSFYSKYPSLYGVSESNTLPHSQTSPIRLCIFSMLPLSSLPWFSNSFSRERNVNLQASSSHCVCGE